MAFFGCRAQNENPEITKIFYFLSFFFSGYIKWVSIPFFVHDFRGFRDFRGFDLAFLKNMLKSFKYEWWILI